MLRIPPGPASNSGFTLYFLPVNYSIHGQVFAEICRELRPSGATGYLRFYDSATAGRPAHAADFETPIATGKELEWLGEQPLAREPIDEDGSFKVGIDDRQQGYGGGEMIVVLELPFMPPMRGPEAAFPTQFVLLGQLNPQWSHATATPRWAWNHCIPSSTWCLLLRSFHVCCLAGTLRSAASHSPIASVHLKWLATADGPTLQAVTDAQGEFRIWWRGDAASLAGAEARFSLAMPDGSPLTLLEKVPTCTHIAHSCSCLTLLATTSA